MAFNCKPRLAGGAGTSVLRNQFGLEYQIGLLIFLVLCTKSYFDITY